MLAAFARLSGRLLVATVRALWSGPLATKLRVLLCLATAFVAATTVAGPAVGQMLALLLILGGLFAIYAVVLRG